MVVVDTVSTCFEADLLAAKLGVANGILWEVRGGFQRMLMYPVGPLDVLVPVEEEEEVLGWCCPPTPRSAPMSSSKDRTRRTRSRAEPPRAPSPAVRWMI